MSILEKLSQDLSEHIDSYRQNRDYASTSTTCYRACEFTMTKIEALTEFAERYLGYEISLHTGSEVTQFTPVDILGFSIEAVQDMERH